jgi:phage tail-like protein
MQSSEIELLLPEIFRRTLSEDNPLRAFLEVMEALHVPSEVVLSHLEHFFDPYRTPDIFVPYLSGWLDLDQVWIQNPEEFTAKTLPPFPAGVGRLRELVANAAYLSKWRGTARGLLTFLEIATGVSEFTVDEAVPDASGKPIPFHIRVHAPKAGGPYEALIRKIIELEKPAYVTYELQIES